MPKPMFCWLIALAALVANGSLCLHWFAGPMATYNARREYSPFERSLMEPARWEMRVNGISVGIFNSQLAQVGGEYEQRLHLFTHQPRLLADAGISPGDLPENLALGGGLVKVNLAFDQSQILRKVFLSGSSSDGTVHCRVEGSRESGGITLRSAGVAGVPNALELPMPSAMRVSVIGPCATYRALSEGATWQTLEIDWANLVTQVSLATLTGSVEPVLTDHVVVGSTDIQWWGQSAACWEIEHRRGDATSRSLVRKSDLINLRYQFEFLGYTIELSRLLRPVGPADYVLRHGQPATPWETLPGGQALITDAGEAPPGDRQKALMTDAGENLQANSKKALMTDAGETPPGDRQKAETPPPTVIAKHPMPSPTFARPRRS